jgi:hypothetical protein
MYIFIINPLNAKLNPICHLLALGAHPILHISRVRVNYISRKVAGSICHIYKHVNIKFSLTT